MCTRAITVSVMLLWFAVVGGQAQEQSPAPTPEEMVSRLRYQWEALFVAAILNAQTNGQSGKEFGASVGRLFAPSWGRELTPQGLARGVTANIRLVGLEAELVEDTPEQPVLRFSRPDSVQYYARYGELGATLTDYDDALKAIGQHIAMEHGLFWDQRRDGTWMVVRITRKT